jgi:hypothetical protein
MKQTRDSKALQLILLVLITATVCGAQTYVIRFSSSAPVGQSFAVTATGSMHQEMSSGAGVLDAKEYDSAVKEDGHGTLTQAGRPRSQSK